MINAVIIQRLATLEREVQAIKSYLWRVATPPAKDAKKLTRGLQVALREIEEGKEIGPFKSVEEFMVGIN